MAGKNGEVGSIDSTLMRLGKMRRQVEIEKTELSKLQGKRSALEDRLRNEFGNTAAGWRRRGGALSSSMTSSARRNKAINEELEALRGKYDFGEI